jgi:hypothetical protein
MNTGKERKDAKGRNGAKRKYQRDEETRGDGGEKS